MLEFLLSLSILKAPLGINLYLNIIPVLLGLLFILKNFRVNKVFTPMVILLIIGGFRSLSLMDFVGIARIGQVACLLGLASMSKNWINEKRLFSLAQNLLIFGVLALLLEKIFIGAFEHPKMFFGIELLRFHGPIGESNYSALLFAFCALIFVINKKLWHFLISFFCVFQCVSRTATMIIIFFIFLYYLWVLFGNKLLWPLRCLALALVLTPIWIWLSFKFLPLSYLQILERFSSGRIFLYIPYVEMGMDQIFGVGYFNGWDRFAEYLGRFSHIDTGRNLQINEQHNIFIQIFSEFGILCYPLWVWQILSLYWKKNENLLPLIFLTSLLVGFSLLNGLNEFILYLAFAWVIAENKIPNVNLTRLFYVKSR